MALEFTINDDLMPRLREMQAALGCVDLKTTANMLMSLGSLVTEKALEGGQVAIVYEDEDRWNPVSHPALEHIKTIRAEKT